MWGKVRRVWIRYSVGLITTRLSLWEVGFRGGLTGRGIWRWLNLGCGGVLRFGTEYECQFESRWKEGFIVPLSRNARSRGVRNPFCCEGCVIWLVWFDTDVGKSCSVVGVGRIGTVVGWVNAKVWLSCVGYVTGNVIVSCVVGVVGGGEDIVMA